MEVIPYNAKEFAGCKFRDSIKIMASRKKVLWIIVARLLHPQTLLPPVLIFAELNSHFKEKWQNLINLHPTKMSRYTLALTVATKSSTLPPTHSSGGTQYRRCYLCGSENDADLLKLPTTKFMREIFMRF